MSQDPNSNPNAPDNLLHDQLTHFLMQHHEFATLFFQTILDNETVEAIQWHTFERLPDRHTSQRASRSIMP